MNHDFPAGAGKLESGEEMLPKLGSIILAFCKYETLGIFCE